MKEFIPAKSVEMEYLISIQSVPLYTRNPFEAFLKNDDRWLKKSLEPEKKMLDCPVGSPRSKCLDNGVNATQSDEKSPLTRKEKVKKQQDIAANGNKCIILPTSHMPPRTASLTFRIPCEQYQKKGIQATKISLQRR